VTVTLTLILFQPGGSLADAAAVYLFVQNYWPSDIARFVEHAWSIDVEVGFYLLMPAVAVLLTWLARTLSGARARLLILLYLLLAGIALGEFLILSEAPGSGALRTVLSWLPFLLLGLVLATIEPTAVARLRGRERAGAPAIALLAGALHLRFSLGDRPSPEGSVVTLFVGAGCLIAAPLVLQWGERPCWRALDNRALRWIGERSYSMYLLHVIPILLLAPLVASLASGSPWDILLGLLALELAILLPAAALSYRFVERPFLALKRRRVAGSLRPMSGRPRSARAQSGDRRASDSATQS
jgi:peptidoglycan/LPS O-acetylase OafA/YrhL